MRFSDHDFLTVAAFRTRCDDYQLKILQLPTYFRDEDFFLLERYGQRVKITLRTIRQWNHERLCGQIGEILRRRSLYRPVSPTAHPVPERPPEPEE